ncbi:MAG TPA: arsenite efflux transporter metallochaperone ArsD [Holophaga sp.]|nr:arsenite efflux transporter metallochaperone ArsD [Holophaga sp.]HPS67974.1 arsenite efflux transporter metallochaperone ArsD [Holophaga sp.]
MKIRVFDPPMCCSTGICGPSVDPELVRFAADLDWLKAQGIEVERYNLSQQPFEFTADPEVNAALHGSGVEALPIVKAGGSIRSQGKYPSRADLALWAGVEPPLPSIYTEAVAELVAIGAAIASNCETCFRAHYDKARKLGVSREDMMRAVTTARTVREVPAGAVLGLAERYLKPRQDAHGTDRTTLNRD